MELQEIVFSDKFSLSEGQKGIISRIIEWKDTPPVVKSGRSTFLVLSDPAVPFTGLKIKGCGYFNTQNMTADRPLSKDPYVSHIINAPDGVKEVHYQIEVNDENELMYSIPGDRPYGAQTFKRAKLEYDVNSKLFEIWKDKIKDMPFYVPVGYAKYKDLEYKNEPLGITLLGMDVIPEVPLAAYFEARFEDKGLRINQYIFTYWQNHIAPIAKNQPDYFDLLLTIKKLAFEFGRSLSFLHEYFVDHDSHLFNATVNNNTGKVIFYDLDHVISQENMHSQKYFYYSLKDFEIGLTALTSNFMLSGLAEGIILFEEMKQETDGYNFIESFYQGYFGILDDDLKENANTLWERILMFYANKVLTKDQKKHIHLVYDFCEFERENSYIEIFNPLFAKIKNKRIDFTLEKSRHEKIVSAFLKQKSDITKLHKM
ncbi:hypothetical protein JW911_00925 [Candidatus Peregrinibacteria bacterium]|nr:hypothetical protein [Candidatus Peregrinibacteria bacterium]